MHLRAWLSLHYSSSKQLENIAEKSRGSVEEVSLSYLKQANARK